MEKANKGTIQCAGESCSFMGQKKSVVLSSLFVFVSCFTTPVDSTIRVISLNGNETVYTIQERALILRSADGLEGVLVKAYPSNACNDVASPPDINGTFVNWIILATWQGLGDSCSLLHKIKNAENAGYSAIVIQTTSGNDSDFIPVSDWYGIGIFPCLVTYDDGNILSANYTTEDYILKFEDEPINTWLGFFIASVLVILAILLAIGLSYVIVQMFVLILLWIRETIVHTIQQRRRNRRRRLPASQLKKLPVLSWNSDIPQDTCTICLDSFTPEDKVRILPCSHVFHQVCIDPWLLKQRRKCPNCKGKIVFPDERCDSDSSTEDERTPLIRRSSVDRDRTQIFTFSDHDISRSQPMYTAIHRIFDEAENLPRPLDQQGPSRPSHAPVPVHASTSAGSLRQSPQHASNLCESCGEVTEHRDPSTNSSSASRLIVKAKRFGKYVPKFGKSTSQKRTTAIAASSGDYMCPVVEESSPECPEIPVNTPSTSAESVSNSSTSDRNDTTESTVDNIVHSPKRDVIIQSTTVYIEANHDDNDESLPPPDPTRIDENSKDFRADVVQDSSSQ